MADQNRRFGLANQLDIKQMLSEAQHRWLRPAEIYEILQNYKKFKIAPEPANMPQSGSLYLFDRKVLRYFRKDGHNWRKKRDGKTVKEAHEKLKVGSIDTLHCYYAHGEPDESFQRRTYWMLEEDFSHIVLVHYLEVKGNKINAHQLNDTEGHPPFCETENVGTNYDMESSLSSGFTQSNYRIHSQTIDTTSSNSIQVSEYEDVESAYNNQPIWGSYSYVQSEKTQMQNTENGSTDPYYPVPVLHPSKYYGGQVSVIPEMGLLSLLPAAISQNANSAEVAFGSGDHADDPIWENIARDSKPRSQPMLPQSSFFTSGHDTSETMKESGDTLGQLSSNSFGYHPELARSIQVQEKSQWSADGKLLGDTQQVCGSMPQEEVNSTDLIISSEPSATTVHQNDDSSELSNARSIVTQSYHVPLERPNLTFAPRSHFSNVLAAEGLQKIDSFNRWMSKELGDDILLPQSTPGPYWDTTDGDAAFESPEPSREQDNSFMLGPSISQEQLFSIIDFSPSWTYTGSAIKVLIAGRFLKSRTETEVCKWSCMFGEVEVPAGVVADGVLCCCAPMHEAGRVPFYVTCSNRLACSEVREFEYRVNDSYDEGSSSDNGNTLDKLKTRFAKLLCLDSPCPTDVNLPNLGEKSELSHDIYSLLNEDYSGWDDLLMLTTNEFSPEKAKQQVYQNLLKQKLCDWLIIKATEGGKGASVLDEGGQGVLHFASALGYDWALQPTVMAGVSLDFRDANGWTALHWAASCGRERTVATLISLGASPGALTDPSPVHPSGRTPADLASDNGHKGIAGFLAESHLSVHLSLLNLDSNKGQMVDKSGITATPLERNSTHLRDGESPSQLSLKDSLSAVCNATQAAALIHQAFRVMSFQRKQMKDLGDDKFWMSDERAVSLVASKTYIPGKGNNPLHAAATRIQNKFRGWKGRKEFLITRKRIVTIQAHFRGHQVRKYKKIIWSVWILEKIILRWRRKRNGLRSFAPRAVAQTSNAQDASLSEDDDDFLRKGRKQTEERLQKALARVKSMAQYPEARDQYSRLSNDVSEMRLYKVQGLQEKYAMSSIDTDESPCFGDDLIDIERLLDDDETLNRPDFEELSDW